MSIQGNWDRRRVSRGTFLKGMGATALVLGGVGFSADPVFAKPKFDSNPFTLGVASGDPLPDGVVIWTRLAPDPLNGGGLPNRSFRVRYKVATDENMRNVVEKGRAVARPEMGHSVHVDVRGLRPDREYYYQFKVGAEESPVGRTRTTPALGASVASLAFAFVSCQDYQNGFYAAYNAMVREAETGVQDLDFVVHLGDYIYEYGSSEMAVPGRQHNGPEIITLEDYRNRHALYRSDQPLRDAHRIFPFIVTTDDHETENNYADEIPEEGSQTPKRRDFLARRAASYQAYYEHMPLRRTSLPQGPDMRLYRRFAYGDLVEFSVLDTRQYRTDQPCGDGLKERCAEALSESQTMTGPEQEQWLKKGLIRSSAVWNAIAQQTMLAQYDFNGVPGRGENQEMFNLDQWDGYVAARNRLIGFLDKRGIRNPITLTGDIHSSWVHDLKTDFDDENSKTVGAEFVGTSITSSFPGAFIAPVEAARPDNPHNKFFDGANRGYVVCNVDREQWETTFKAVPTEPGQGSVVVEDVQATTPLATFVVESGRERQGAQQVGQTNSPSPRYTGPPEPFDPDRIN